MANKDFPYTPLPEGHIRILHIFPAEYEDDKDWESELLQCSMDTVPLDEAEGKYVALSYCWGKSDADYALFCGEDILKVQSNLFHALCAFRKQRIQVNGRNLVKAIWVDALCINQSDNDEKNKQIMMMQHIYAKAALTQIYLGCASDHPSLTGVYESLNASLFQPTKMVKLAVVGATDLMDRFDENPQMSFHDILCHLVQKAGFPSRDDNLEKWSSYQTLLMRPWFNRIWVVQEAVAHPGRTVVIANDVALNWDEFVLLNRISLLQLEDETPWPGTLTCVATGFQMADETLTITEIESRWRSNRINIQTMDEIAKLKRSQQQNRFLEENIKSKQVQTILYDHLKDRVKGKIQTNSHIQLSLSNVNFKLPAVNTGNVRFKVTPTGLAYSNSKTGERQTANMQTGVLEDESLTGGQESEEERMEKEVKRRKEAFEANFTHPLDGAATKKPKSPLDLFSLLKKCHKFCCTNKRDALYGLYGLADDTDSIPQPDYNLTLDEVWHQYATYFITQGYGNEVMTMVDNSYEETRPCDITWMTDTSVQMECIASYCPDNKWMTDLCFQTSIKPDPLPPQRSTRPSWAPDFSRIGMYVPGKPDGWKQRHFTAYRAGGSGDSATCHFGIQERNPNQLVVRGATIVPGHTVVALGPPMYSQHHIECITSNIRHITFNLLTHVQRWARESFEFIRAQFDSGRLKVESNGDSNSQLMLLYNTVLAGGDKQTLCNLNDYYGKEDASSTVSLLTVGTGQYYNIPAGRHPGMNTYMRVTENLQARRLAVTEGGALAIVPSMTREGDEFCLLRGSPAPLLVRGDAKGKTAVTDSSAGFTIIGDAYVHGLMNGELADLCTEEVVFI